MKRILALAVLAALAGCSSHHQPDPHTAEATPPGDAPRPFFCPQPARQAQTYTLTEFLPGRADVAAQITTAQITGIAGSCTLAPKKDLLVVNFQAGFAATNGPANHGAPLALTYFVAVTDGDDVVSKTDYTITLAFDGNASTAQATSKPVKIDIERGELSHDMQILVGFEMTADQLNYAESHPAP
jgi:hypothetical protein